MIVESLLLHALLTMPALELKCGGDVAFPGSEERTPVVVIEGRVIVGELDDISASLTAEDIHHVNVTCWNPTTDEMPARSGVSVIAITTKQAVAEAQADLRFLQGAVRDFHAAEDRFPADVSEVGLSEPDAVRFSMTATDAGLRLATAGMRDAQCSVAADADDAVELTCEPSVSLAKASLREAWDRAVDAGRAPY